VSGEVTGTAQGYFGWKVVGAAFVLAVFGWGIGFYGPSVFLRTLHAERGWPIALISVAITMHFLFSAFFVAYLPQAYARWGLAHVTQGGILCTAAGAILWGNASAAWQLFPIAAVSGAGSAATTGAAINAIVAPSFDKERPKALSLAFNGASIGGLIFTPLWAMAIGRFGFATTADLMGLGALAVLWPISLRYLHRGPGATGSSPSTVANSALLRDRGFLAISGAFALGLFAQVGLFAHLVTRLAPVVGTDGAALAVSLVTICAVLGRSLFRRLLGDDNRRHVAAANFLVQACGTALLTFARGTPELVCGCVLFGLGVGNLVSLPPLIIQKEFAAADVGKAVADGGDQSIGLCLCAGSAGHHARHREQLCLVVCTRCRNSAHLGGDHPYPTARESSLRERMNVDVDPDSRPGPISLHRKAARFAPGRCEPAAVRPQFPDGSGMLNPSFASASRTYWNRSYCDNVMGPLYASLCGLRGGYCT
jgi:predicted MFS family arabinose efflux permease